MKKLLVIGFVWPEPNSTAAGSRMLQLLQLFIKNNFEITFVSTATKGEKSFNLESLNIQTINIQLNSNSFNEFLKQLKPNIVLFDRYLTEEQFGWRVEETCPNALRVLDTEDLHFLRNARHTAYKKNEQITLDLLNNDITKREIASIYRCDLTLIISKFEMNLLLKTFKIPKSLLIYTPFLLNKITNKITDNYPSFKNRTHFISIGNFKHEPNWNAVLHLKKVIWPLIKKELPTAELHIYGAYATDKVLQLNNKAEGFIIKGWAENLESVFIKSKVCLAPIQFGAGLKGKLIDAMKYGTPSVTTLIGAEAMHGKLPWNGYITQTDNDFAKKAITLYNNTIDWETAQKNGFIIINKCYNNKKYGKKLINKIENLTESLENHRLNNFIGGILLHHKNKSTKYFSKWIEEKNK